MTDQPRVTVIATCYNHGRFLVECLDSIAAQHYENLQLIVTDDRSNDDSRELISDWITRSTLDTTFLANDVNQGLVRTLNAAWRLADGEFVVPIATDDVMEPGRLHAQIPFFASLPDSVAVVYSDAVLIDEAGNVTGEGSCAGNWGGGPPPEGSIFDRIVRLNFIPAPAVTIRRSCKEAVGDYDESLAFEDLDMWLRLARRFEFRFSPFVGARYRIVHGSMSMTRRSTIAESHIRILEKWVDDPEVRHLVLPRLRGATLHYSGIDRKASLPHLRRLCDLLPGWSPWARYLLTRAGVGYGLQQQVIRGLRRQPTPRDEVDPAPGAARSEG